MAERKYPNQPLVEALTLVLLKESMEISKGQVDEILSKAKDKLPNVDMLQLGQMRPAVQHIALGAGHQTESHPVIMQASGDYLRLLLMTNGYILLWEPTLKDYAGSEYSFELVESIHTALGNPTTKLVNQKYTTIFPDKTLWSSVCNLPTTDFLSLENVVEIEVAFKEKDLEYRLRLAQMFNSEGVKQKLLSTVGGQLKEDAQPAIFLKNEVAPMMNTVFQKILQPEVLKQWSQ